MGPTSDPSLERAWLRNSDQACIAVLVTASLAVMMSAWFHAGGPRGRLVDLEVAERFDPRYRLDVNEADWPEWTLLPGIGETLARRIVVWRRSQGPFRRPEDLLSVAGIGPRTLERLRPYLLPIAADDSTRNQ